MHKTEVQFERFLRANVHLTVRKFKFPYSRSSLLVTSQILSTLVSHRRPDVCDNNLLFVIVIYKYVFPKYKICISYFKLVSGIILHLLFCNCFFYKTLYFWNVSMWHIATQLIYFPALSVIMCDRSHELFINISASGLAGYFQFIAF